MVDDQTMTDAELIFVFDPEGISDAIGQADAERMERRWLKMLWDDYPAWAEKHP